jgi:hypothetical protein
MTHAPTAHRTNATLPPLPFPQDKTHPQGPLGRPLQRPGPHAQVGPHLVFGHERRPVLLVLLPQLLPPPPLGRLLFRLLVLLLLVLVLLFLLLPCRPHVVRRVAIHVVLVVPLLVPVLLLPIAIRFAILRPRSLPAPAPPPLWRPRPRHAPRRRRRCSLLVHRSQTPACLYAEVSGGLVWIAGADKRRQTRHTSSFIHCFFISRDAWAESPWPPINRSIDQPGIPRSQSSSSQ